MSVSWRDGFVAHQEKQKKNISLHAAVHAVHATRRRLLSVTSTNIRLPSVIPGCCSSQPAVVRDNRGVLHEVYHPFRAFV